MAVVLGLAAAIVYGASDFLGGLATRRSGAYAVVVWSQFAGLLILAAAVLLTGETLPPTRDLVWGAVGGIGGGSGVVLLYRGLAIGRMAIVAPTAAVGGAVIPVVVGLALGERPPALALVGVLVAVAAIGLVSSSHAGASTGAHRRRLPPGFIEAVGAGLGFALFFVALDRTTGTADLWPLLAARVSIAVAGLAGIATRSTLRPAPGSLAQIACLGVLDMVANLLYILASRRGLLSIVAVLVSLYPASTVVLARFVLGERFTRPQLAGLVAAAAGVTLIAVV